MSRYLGIDFGTRRVGIALSDNLRLFATPHAVVETKNALAEVIRLVETHDVSVVVVGLATGLKGQTGPITEAARQFGAKLESDTNARVVFQDERFTSRLAEQSLLESGMNRRDRKGKIDKVAASIILQSYLDSGLPEVGRETNGDS